MVQSYACLKDHVRIPWVDGGGSGGNASSVQQCRRETTGWAIVLAVGREQSTRILKVFWMYRSQKLVSNCLQSSQELWLRISHRFLA